MWPFHCSPFDRLRLVALLIVIVRRCLVDELLLLMLFEYRRWCLPTDRTEARCRHCCGGCLLLILHRRGRRRRQYLL